MDFRTVTMVHLVQFGHEFLCVCFCKLRAVTKLAVSKVTAATWRVALRSVACCVAVHRGVVLIWPWLLSVLQQLGLL